MLKKRILALVTAIVLTVAVVGTSVAVANSLVDWVTPGGQAIACQSSGSAGGGC